MKNSLARLFPIVALFGCALSVHAAGPLLMQKPTLSKTHIAFAYAGDLWLVAREGGEARLREWIDARRAGAPERDPFADL